VSAASSMDHNSSNTYPFLIFELC